MKHVKLLTAVTTSVALLGVAIPVVNHSTTTTVQAKTKKVSYKASTTKNSITYKDTTASMTFNKAKGYHIIGGDKAPLYSEIIITGKFTNKSKKNMKPYTFFTKHFTAYQNTKNAAHEISGLTGYITSAPTRSIAKLGSAAHASVKPGKTVKFALCSDTLPTSLKNNQQITLKAHKNAYLPSKTLKSKKFSVGKVSTTMSYEDISNNDK